MKFYEITTLVLTIISIGISIYLIINTNTLKKFVLKDKLSKKLSSQNKKIVNVMKIIIEDFSDGDKFDTNKFNDITMVLSHLKKYYNVFDKNQKKCYKILKKSLNSNDVEIEKVKKSLATLVGAIANNIESIKGDK